MSPIQAMVFFLLGLAHFSLAKVCPGCAVNVDPNNKAAYKYLRETLASLRTTIPKGLEQGIQAELVRIINVKEQVLAGISYSYDFEARDVNTKKSYECNLQVLRQAWKKEDKIIEYSCHEVPSNNNHRSFLGGEVYLFVDDNDKLQGLKTFIGQEVAKELNSKYLMTVIKYFKASMQVVEGTLIKATVEVANTNCPLDKVSDTANCEAQSENRQVCDVQVWLKPWMKVKELTQVQCRPHPEFCAGCPIETNTNNVALQRCLERTLSNLNAESHSRQKLSLVKINKAISQVVDGMKYTVDFDSRDAISERLLNCNAVIISQPWISEEPHLKDFKCEPSTTVTSVINSK